ncbi:major facilitator superfamily domain-containing protein [Aspergillus pseudoustus]|uniref:Major facilitator superfamily domain-containing protein n=1 Tax=Aspergillus pseudoustus TaxID=1810923 RepID=A0ABR4JR64_9EURO
MAQPSPASLVQTLFGIRPGGGQPSPAFSRYPRRTFWLIYAVWVLVISGFDNTASSTVISIPRFRMDYGFAYDGNYILPARWQAAFSGGPAAGGVISALAASYLSDRVGRKPVYLAGLIVVFVAITLETVSNGSCAMFFGGKFLTGIAMGCFFSPVAIRGIISAAAPISSSASQLVVSLIQHSYGDLPNAWTFTALAIWPFLPEYPWYLIRHGKDEQAAETYRRFGLPEAEIEKTIANAKLTEAKNREETTRVTFAECFHKPNLRRTIITVGPLPFQRFAASSSSSAIFLIDRVGRRNLMLGGLGLLTVMLFVTGGLAIGAAAGSIKASYMVLSEIATPRLRSKTVSIAIVLQSSIDIMWTFGMPYIFNPNQANLGEKTTFIFGGFSIICWTYLYLYHPETKGRSFQELDEMFTKRVPTKKFRTYVTETEQRGAQVKRDAQGLEQTL